ncbi:MAG: PadR family transcriptional regulator, partial [Actinomycetes bacterium]
MMVDISSRYIDHTLTTAPEGNLIELAVLGLLKEQPLHGYELRKRLAATLGLVATVSFGSLYPALSKLEASGAVSVLTGPPPDAEGRGTQVARIPMTGSLGGERAAFRAGPGRVGDPARDARSPRSTRQRKVYAITEAGLQAFERLLAGEDLSPEDDRGFDLRLALARHLAPEGRLALLERRRAALLGRRARVVDPGNDRWAAALVERRAEALGADIDWLDRLIAAETA